MRTEIVPESRLAARGAEHVAAALHAAVEARGYATIAFSGGSTTGPLLAALAEAHVPWLGDAAKAPIVRRFVDGDTSIPAGRVEASRAILLLDPPAAAALPSP